MRSITRHFVLAAPPAGYVEMLGEPRWGAEIVTQ
jgi:hypothetical protein